MRELFKTKRVLSKRTWLQRLRLRSFDDRLERRDSFRFWRYAEFPAQISRQALIVVDRQRRISLRGIGLHHRAVSGLVERIECQDSSRCTQRRSESSLPARSARAAASPRCAVCRNPRARPESIRQIAPDLVHQTQENLPDRGFGAIERRIVFSMVRRVSSKASTQTWLASIHTTRPSARIKSSPNDLRASDNAWLKLWRAWISVRSPHRSPHNASRAIRLRRASRGRRSARLSSLSKVESRSRRRTESAIRRRYSVAVGAYFSFPNLFFPNYF